MNNKNIIAVQNLIRCLSVESLKNKEVVANLVRAFGIVQWGPNVFGLDEMFKNASSDMAGIYQTPDQIAGALVYLSDYKINSYCEVGVFQGGNFVFVSEYLKRFNPDIKCLGIDPTNYLNSEIADLINKEPWISLSNKTSEAFAGTVFDLVFIDGEHTGGWVIKDFNNLGQHAKICMFHDIQEPSCPEVINFWVEIKKEKESKVFLDCNSPGPSQGIGIIHREE